VVCFINNGACGYGLKSKELLKKQLEKNLQCQKIPIIDLYYLLKSYSLEQMLSFYTVYSKTDLKTDLKNLTIEEKIIECIRMNARVSIPELSKKIEKGITSTEEYLQKMKEKKILQHAGPTNGGHWEILNNK